MYFLSLGALLGCHPAVCHAPNTTKTILGLEIVGVHLFTLNMEESGLVLP
jgi:hypothetical protein